MSRWFRMYDDALDDEKINFLSDKSFRGWFKLLCLASKNNGILPPLKNIAFRLRLNEQATSKLLDELCGAGLLDPIEVENAPMSYEPHNWKDRQYKSDVSTDRVKRFRNAQRNASETFQQRSEQRNETVSETPPETEQKQRQKETRCALSPDWPPDYRDQFWNKFPNKVGKPRALKKLDGLARGPTRWVDLMAGLDRYIQNKPPDRPWLNPETFLNQERWADQPATVVQLRRVPDV